MQAFPGFTFLSAMKNAATPTADPFLVVAELAAAAAAAAALLLKFEAGCQDFFCFQVTSMHFAWKEGFATHISQANALDLSVALFCSGIRLVSTCNEPILRKIERGP